MECEKIPFAERLEAFVEHVVNFNPVWIGIVAIDKNGIVTTGYTKKDNDNIHKAMFAMLEDTALNWLKANKKYLQEFFAEGAENENLK